jgi:UDP-glucose 4-epimerase
MRVVLTGASGYIAGRMLEPLHARYDLILLDRRARNRDGKAVEGVQIVDLADPNRDAYRKHFRGAHALVHCAWVPSVGLDGPDERFRAELENITIAYNVYQVSLEEGVRRVVVASSNHAADWYERLWWKGECDLVTPELRALSDNYYGWAKEAYEHLGFTFACGRENGTRLEVVQLRIGAPRETDVADCEPGDLARVRRSLAVYLSQRDQVQLFVRSVEADDIRDEHGVPFQIFYGISANWSAFWSTANARRVIGYEPADVAEIRFIDEVARHVRAAKGRQRPIRS